MAALLSRRKIGAKNEIHCRSDFSRDECATFLEGELLSEPKNFSVLEGEHPCEPEIFRSCRSTILQ